MTQSNNFSTSSLWQQGAVVELTITGLNHQGEGIGRFDGRVVFVPDTAPGDRLEVRLVRVKKNYALAQLLKIVKSSPQRTRPSCIVADKCGGCQWQHLDYQFQIESKQQQIIDALERIGGFTALPLEPLLQSPASLGYRNKATYPLARSKTGQVQAGYYRKGSHRLVNINQCPVQDDRLNLLLTEVKKDIENRGWSIYDEEKKQGKLRHLSLRIGQRTGEMLLTLISAHKGLPDLAEQAGEWLERYPDLGGICLNIQPEPNNRIFGEETMVIAGRGTCREKFADLSFSLGANTFFQVNSGAAELLLTRLQQALNLQGNELLVDAYAGVGTFTLPLARQVRQAIAIEVNQDSVHQGQRNAEINQITNVDFLAGTVETVLPALSEIPDILLLDPPRKGCTPEVLKEIIQQRPGKIAYISCQPPTLARDLKFLCAEGSYQITWVQGCDFFPQTAHVECAVILEVANG
ncbi:23S rRNA (uracil(1939)-C(5))-methyltransferase RlmD [Synechocystis salina LEGE 06155]|nr:23S rRNA (uracil(1939)-C(5))-methyltransferase RlmD [Synechocystis salina LEGE 06155]